MQKADFPINPKCNVFQPGKWAAFLMKEGGSLFMITFLSLIKTKNPLAIYKIKFILVIIFIHSVTLTSLTYYHISNFNERTVNIDLFDLNSQPFHQLLR